MDSEFSKLFEKLIPKSANFILEKTDPQKVEKYVSVGVKQDIPKYTPIRVGPKPITVEEYKKRNSLRKETSTNHVTAQKKKTRAGKQVKLQRQITELYRIIPLARGQQKKDLLNKLKEVKAKKTQKMGNWWSTPTQAIAVKTEQQTANHNTISNDNSAAIIIGIIVLAFVVYKIDKYFKRYVHKYNNIDTKQNTIV